MLLAVDVGNTQTHFGAYKGAELIEHWRFATVRTSTADELGARLRALLELRRPRVRRPRRVDRLLDGAAARARVGRDGGALPRPRDARRRARRQDRPRDPVRQPAGRSAPTGSSTRSPSASASAAPRSAVDFGTAVNFDVISGAGEYLGGVLVPGVEISLEALTERGAKLPKIELAAPRGDHRQVDGRRDPRRRRLRLRRRGRRDHPAPEGRGAGRRGRRRRHRRPGAPHRAALRGDRRDRRPPHAHGPAPHPRAQPRLVSGGVPERALTDSWSLGGITIPNRVVLAPLAGIGNWFVRLQAKRYGAGLVFSRDGVELRHPPRQREDDRRDAAHGAGGEARRAAAVRAGPRRHALCCRLRRRAHRRRHHRPEHGLPRPEGHEDRRRRGAHPRPGHRRGGRGGGARGLRPARSPSSCGRARRRATSAATSSRTGWSTRPASPGSPSTRARPRSTTRASRTSSWRASSSRRCPCR